MIQVGFRWKESAVKLDNIDELARLGLALKNSGTHSQVMVYYEFTDPEELMLFCKSLGIMQVVKDIETLVEQKQSLEMELQKLNEKVDKKKGLNK